MKRVVLVFLCLLLVMLTGCTKTETVYDGGPAEITIWVDDGSVSFVSPKQEGLLVPYLRDFAKTKYPEIEINGELVSVYKDGYVDEVATDNLMQNLRTEVIAGGGPDIYILPASYNGYTGTEPLFKDVREAMDNGIFLPLDDYIADSEIINLEEYPAAIMDAGVNDFGRVVMPLSYTIPLLVYEKEKLSEPGKSYSSFEELMNTDDPVLADSLETYAPQFIGRYFSSFGDYDSSNVTVSAERIATLLRTAAPEDEVMPGDDILIYEGVPVANENVLYQLCRNADDYTPITVPNDTGGITAYVTWYAAINANCENPAAAFKVLELLFTEEMQTGSYEPQSREAFQNSVLFSLGGGNYEVNGVSVHPKAFSRSEYVEIMDEYNKNITAVRFPTEMDRLLEEACEEIFWEIHSGGKYEDIDFAPRAEEILKEFKMIMAE